MEKRPKRPPLSDLQKKYARILYERGISQTRIAEILHVPFQSISRIKIKEGNWDEYRVPECTASDLLDNLIHLIIRFQISLLSGQESDHTRSVLNIHKLVSSLRDIQELIFEVSNRDLKLALQKHMQWLTEHPTATNPLEAAQQHHDEILI